MKELLFVILGLILLSIGPQLILGAIFTIGIYCLLYCLFKGITGGTDVSSNKTQETRNKQNEKVIEQTIQNTNITRSDTVKRHNSYSANSYSSYRNTSYDGYDDYYDDWHDNDMPPEEGDGFRGTGGPFL